MDKDELAVEAKIASWYPESILALMTEVSNWKHSNSCVEEPPNFKISVLLPPPDGISTNLQSVVAAQETGKDWFEILGRLAIKLKDFDRQASEYVAVPETTHDEDGQAICNPEPCLPIINADDDLPF